MSEKITAAHNEPNLPNRANRLAQAAFFSDCCVSGTVFYGKMPFRHDAAHRVTFDFLAKTAQCDCPFYPKPCLHARAFAEFCTHADRAFFPENEVPPEWATQPHDGARALSQTPDTAAAKAAAKNQRRHERLERAAAGLDDLETWLMDTARRGLAASIAEDPAALQHIATRMADAGLTGLSRTLRVLGSITTQRADWAEKISKGIAQCYLAVRAFKQREKLSEGLLFDLQTFLGINTRREEVLAWPDWVSDDWFVLGRMEEIVEDHNKMRKTWLLGLQTKRHALIIDYDFNRQGFPPGLSLGRVFSGEIAFYPSAHPQRALIPDALELKAAHAPDFSAHGFSDLASFKTAYAQAIGEQPWLAAFPALFPSVKIAHASGHFYVLDNSHNALCINALENTGWQLVALNAKAPIALFGIWDGKGFTPISVMAEGRFISLM